MAWHSSAKSAALALITIVAAELPRVGGWQLNYHCRHAARMPVHIEPQHEAVDNSTPNSGTMTVATDPRGHAVSSAPRRTLVTNSGKLRENVLATSASLNQVNDMLWRRKPQDHVRHGEFVGSAGMLWVCLCIAFLASLCCASILLRHPDACDGLPSTMKVLGGDGRLHVEKIGFPKQRSSDCCSDNCVPPSTGGWYGPFGFFRLVACAFMALAVLAVIMAIIAAVEIQQRYLCFIGSVLLFLAACLATAAAYSHEGLANEVAHMAKQNSRFAEKNARFAKQLNKLASVNEKLKGIGFSMGDNLEDLERTLNALQKCAQTEQLSTILRAFTSTDSSVNKDMLLTHDEVGIFFNDSSECFRQAAPEYDLEPIQQEAPDSGTFDLYMMRILVMAVIAGGDATPGKTTALLTLIAFSLNPSEQLDAARDEITHILAGTMTTDEVRAKLEEAYDPEDPKPIHCVHLMELAEKVFRAESSPHHPPVGQGVDPLEPAEKLFQKEDGVAAQIRGLQRPRQFTRFLH
eukprot:gnl/TRDRNA2_/TRDRNA2_180465_c0_seq1.p1 gnl/TRDRNA2_/TRDRNA2_180465_c0~~gnl/TRDRNA2_/TRDRNA2_180465_c0_seq1.p1  ORF type:complete len:519 (+),score=86.75 gnl/TRDRNA2_/TRDRNA2_180465_c0_seq1:90-1646(+)